MLTLTLTLSDVCFFSCERKRIIDEKSHLIVTTLLPLRGVALFMGDTLPRQGGEEHV